MALAERLRLRAADIRLTDDDGRLIAPSLSIGIAEMEDDEPLDAWIKRADKALYLAGYVEMIQSTWPPKPCQLVFYEHRLPAGQ